MNTEAWSLNPDRLRYNPKVIGLPVILSKFIEILWNFLASPTREWLIIIINQFWSFFTLAATDDFKQKWCMYHKVNTFSITHWKFDITSIIWWSVSFTAIPHYFSTKKKKQQIMQTQSLVVVCLKKQQR